MSVAAVPADFTLKANDFVSLTLRVQRRPVPFLDVTQRNVDLTAARVDPTVQAVMRARFLTDHRTMRTPDEWVATYRRSPDGSQDDQEVARACAMTRVPFFDLRVRIGAETTLSFHSPHVPQNLFYFYRHLWIATTDGSFAQRMLSSFILNKRSGHYETKLCLDHLNLTPLESAILETTTAALPMMPPNFHALVSEYGVNHLHVVAEAYYSYQFAMFRISQ